MPAAMLSRGFDGLHIFTNAVALFIFDTCHTPLALRIDALRAAMLRMRATLNKSLHMPMPACMAVFAIIVAARYAAPLRGPCYRSAH